MIAVWICLGILFVISLILFLVCITTIQIEIRNLVVNSTNEEILQNYNVYIRLKVLNIITYFKIKLDKERIYKIRKFKPKKNKLTIKLQKLANEGKEILRKDVIKYLKSLNIKIEKLKLHLQIGLIDTIFTSISVAFISTIISILLTNLTDKYNKDNFKYNIIPKYDGTLLIKIYLDCIISMKMIHIIDIIYMLIKKKRSVDKNYDRTSNRRAYVCSND